MLIRARYFDSPTQFKKIVLATSFSLVMPQCFAATPDVTNQQRGLGGQLQRELQNQIEREVPPPEPKLEQHPEPKITNPDAQKIAVKGFRFEGNTLLSSEMLQDRIKAWTNTELSFEDLKDVTSAIQDLYARNFRIAQAILPPQDVADGVILIQISEGKLGRVIIDSTNNADPLRIDEDVAKRFIMVGSEELNFIHTEPIDRGLALLNEVPGVIATGAYESGDQEGLSNFRVKLGDGDLLTGLVALNNYGSASTGYAQTTATLGLNNPSGAGDQVLFDAIQSLGSSYAQLGYNLPMGYTGWRGGIQTSYLDYRTLTSFSSTQTEGTAKTTGLNATYALLRDHGTNASLRFAFDNRNYDNNQVGVNISKYRVNALSAGVSGNFFDSPTSVVSYGLTCTTGILSISNAAQATQDAGGPNTVGKYLKYNFNVTRSDQLSFLPSTTWTLSANGQIANKNLNSSEQIYLGGVYGVQAYPTSQGGGSEGAVVTTDIQYRLDENWQFGPFLDAGFVRQYVHTYTNWQGQTHADNNYALFAAGLSFKLSYERWLVNGSIAARLGSNPLYNSSGLQLNSDNAYRAVQGWIRASYNF
jgi:hemolysin activation/secretion protein